MKIWTVLVAAGEGLRFGSKKQLAELAGMPVLLHSTLNASSVSDGIVIVTSADDIDFVENSLKSFNLLHEVVEGGTTRSESVRCGLEKVPHDSEIVIVHDGVRPLASQELFKLVVEKVKNGSEAVVPVVPIADSLRSIDGKQIDRDEVLIVQTDDSSLVELAGGIIDFVDGDVSNLKITVKSDLLIAEQFLIAEKSN